MARKKRGSDEHPEETPQPEGLRPKPRPKAKAKKPRKPPIPSARELETLMWGMLGLTAPDESPESARSRSMEVLQRAFRASESRQVVALARQALELWPDCADAYVLLAEHALSPKAAADFYRQGVEAASRDLGEEAFENGRGHFWGLLPTRPYMRARFGLAQVLWVIGRRDESIAHYQELLRLNPNDNQGVRYLLAAALLETSRDDELNALLKTYEEDASACWAYSAALLAYRREGASPHAKALVELARRINPFVPQYLSGQSSMPVRMPDGIIRGDQSEAVDYAVTFLNGWKATPGALEWLNATDPRNHRPRASKPKPAKGPTPSSKSRLRKVPLMEEVWQADVRQLPIWVNVADRPHRPWILVVASTLDGFIVGQKVYQEFPSSDELWDELAKTLRSPSEGPPRRPMAIEMGGHENWQTVAKEFESIDVRCAHGTTLDMIDDLVADLTAHLSDRPPLPGLLDMPGVTSERVASFYQAAASFYRSAPWQRVGGSETIKVACDAFESGPWYAVIIGQMGMTLGIALYDSLESLLRIRGCELSDEENARETVALSVTYGRENELPIVDLDAITEHSWEVAAPDAYPCPVRKERGMMMRPPLSWELRLLEAVLRVMPRFIDEHDRDNPASYVHETPTGTGPLTLRLSWVPAHDYD